MLPTPASLEGKPIPYAVFKARPDDQSRDFIGGKRIGNLDAHP